MTNSESKDAHEAHYTWLTDLHLNHCDRDTVRDFLKSIAATHPAGVLISGDFSESTHLIGYLDWIANELTCPIYFVLGNHDFYFSSILRIRSEVTTFCEGYSNLHYLTSSAPIRLSDSIALIGDDGWADGRIGNFERSMVMMNDYRVIEELAGLGKEARWHKLQEFGDQAAARAEAKLQLAMQTHDKIIFLTHVPPFREACWHEGRISDDEWAPHFTSQAMGQMLFENMNQRPDKQLIVLCGHTHGQGTYACLPNLIVYTGRAEYRALHVAGRFDEGFAWATTGPS